MALFGNARLRADMMGDYPPGAVPFMPNPDDRAAALALMAQRTPSPIPMDRPDIRGPIDFPPPGSSSMGDQGPAGPMMMADRASPAMPAASAPPRPGFPVPALTADAMGAPPRGMFGNRTLTMASGGAPSTVDMPDPGQLPMPSTPNLNLDLTNARAKMPGFFQHGGLGEKILHGIGEFGLRYSAGQGNPYSLMVLRERLDAKQRDQQRQWAVEDRDAKFYAPQYFTSGRDRVLFDPRSQQAKVVYDGPEEFQTYADTLGFQPGDEGYDDAVRDYVLRSSGPTAYANRTSLEGVRQDNRVSLEGVRQGNRAALRSMPTYANLHPQARSSGGGGGGNGTMAGVIAPILAKVARGQQLTPGEQQAYSMYRPPSRGRRGTGAGIPTAGGYTVTPGGGSPRVPGTKENPAVLTKPDDYKYLSKGTYFRDPDGHVRQKQ